MNALRRHQQPVERLPVRRYAVMLFLLTAVMTCVVAFTLVRNAKRGTWQQHETALAGGAHVAASTFGNLRSNLRVQASELATSLELQRAVVTRNDVQLQELARSHHALVRLRDRAIGVLPAQPRISSTATISDNGRVLATVTVAVPLGKDVLALMRRQVPLPAHAALVLLYRDRVVAGGPAGAAPQLANGRAQLRTVRFAAQASPLALPDAEV